MLIVGELINASRKQVRPMLEEQDAKGIQALALKQVEGGANYLDVNAGSYPNKEAEYLEWLVKTVQEVTDKPLCLDSANGKAIERALKVHRGTPMINSVSMDSEQQADLLPVIEGADCLLIGLCMGDRGNPPESAGQRVEIAGQLLEVLDKHGIPRENTYLDPLAQTLSADPNSGVEFFNGVRQIMDDYPGVHTICGASNISYGMPARKIVNRAFMVMAIHSGLDAAITNPTDREMMSSILAAEALVGRDMFCENYCNAYRDGLLAV